MDNMKESIVFFVLALAIAFSILDAFSATAISTIIVDMVIFGLISALIFVVVRQHREIDRLRKSLGLMRSLEKEIYELKKKSKE